MEGALTMQQLFDQLSAEFPRESVHWRAQQVSKDGTKALALAYIDARDVMDRLDLVCGPDGWQSEHYSVGGKTACKIGLRSGGETHNGAVVRPTEWIWKSDGAGDTAVEADKGAMSDAFKRAAVHWGIGRYLYDLDAPWVPCESYDRGGKKVFKKFTVDPGTLCRVAWKGPLNSTKLRALLKEFHYKLGETETVEEIHALEDRYSDVLNQARVDMRTWMNGDSERGGLLAAIRKHEEDIQRAHNAQMHGVAQ